ncbi:unnamed protein product [Rotaria sordida]|uniref:Uncharacterized protein n=1 Tax=Rotaria sordida TaxID=392033 RepID=A0A814H0A2_9BILA|nr:unnamed protein product [Rotaria sordida]CAF1021330.1 unnamed protein product [Rotaria sordida]CAF1073309.1 unnamed protein product [Rotaria sordida]CAF1157182.1 unnamed protein product [Rotaria sordida]CAF1345395.1 unnamed protein product [Rotaria sordida]
MPKRQIQHPSEYRILVIGDTGVGKTSLIARYIRNEFPFHSRSHINTDGSTIYQTVIDGNDFTLIFFDISTIYDIQKLKFSDTIPTACFIMFSITDQKSFSKLNYFQEKIRLKFPNQLISIPIIIIGNKIDLESERVVSQESIDKLKSNGVNIFDISVKGNVGIGDVIYTAIKHLQYEQHYRLEKIKPNNVCACILS